MRRWLFTIVAAAACAGAIHAASLPALTARGLEGANDAWDRGDYINALSAYIGLLNAAGGDTLLDPIALKTGELFETRELTEDGRAGRFSPDGQYIVYETGLETSRRTKILKNDGTRAEIADLPGVSATFSPQLAQVAYLRIAETEDLRRASDALEKASLTALNRRELIDTLTWLIAKHSAIVVRDLTSGREMELPAPDLLKTGLTFSGDGRLLYFLGATEDDPRRTDVYVISERAPKPMLVVDAGGLKSAPIVDPAGKVLIYVVPTQNPFRRPAALADRTEARGPGETAATATAGQIAESSQTRSGAQPAGSGRGGNASQPATFAVVDLASRKLSLVAGTAPTLSADGRTLAYVARSGPEYALIVGATTGRQTAIRTGTQRIDAPALSADGTRVAYQAMVRDDWEIFVSARDGSGEQQLTRDIQHDVLPRFISPDRVIALTGEPRHRRSNLYELRSPSDAHQVPTGSAPNAHQVSTRGAPDGDQVSTRSAPDVDQVSTRSAPDGDQVSTRSAPDAHRVRLFHNNTVRTIAPEYQWAASPDGTQILIGAERDGDTVSPARGVYAVDLRHKITKAALLARLRANLKTETQLKAAATRAFQPIATAVRQAVTQASAARIFGYEKALFDFDSKHISKPGNHLASEYLYKTYASFGYRPEYQSFDPAARAAGASASGAEPRTAFNGTTANVVATLRGTTNPQLVYVVSSHFDSVAAGPGADDDTSGTAALLEAARVLADHPMPATIVFASFTGEEAGLLGSREFVRRAVASKMKIAGALNNDMIGWTNDQRLDNTIRYSNAGIRDLQHGAAMLFTRLITYDARYFKGTDAAALYDAYGDVIGGIGSYPVLSSPHYHQASDLLEYENHQLITETSKTTIATLMLLASSPSRLTKLTLEHYVAGSASLSWAPSPENGIRSYIVAYGTPADAFRQRIVVTEPRVTLPRVAPGTIVSVKAVNARGLEGWDWARITLPGAAAASRLTTP